MFLIDMKFISKILMMFYGDRHHFPVPVFEILKNQNAKNKNNNRNVRMSMFQIKFKSSKIENQRLEKLGTQTFQQFQKSRFSDMKNNIVQTYSHNSCIFKVFW